MGNTRFAVIGSPVAHSLSPAIHSAAYSIIGLPYEYTAVEVIPDGLDAFFSSMRRGEYGGVNVTMPCKTAAAAYMDELSDEAAFLGAVNTVVVRDGRLCGYSTDGAGFCASLRESGVVPDGSSIVFFGCGGAARSAAAACAAQGAKKIVFLCRSGGIDSAKSFAAALTKKYGAAVQASPLEDEKTAGELISGCDILVNATPVGMTADGSLLTDPALLRPDAAVFDMIYLPRETQLMRDAARRGCTVAGGLGMLLHQAAYSFHLMTGHVMPVGEVRSILSKKFC